MGLCNFYAKFIPHYSHITSILSSLTKKGTPVRVHWTAECQAALQKLQTCFNNKPFLCLPDLSRHFIVSADASDVAVGSTLLQASSESELLPVMFASRKLSSPETRYSVCEREALAVYWGVNKFKRFLYGQHFFIITDHRPLETINNGSIKNARIMRWFLSLQAFNFTVIYRPGKENVLADYLSRYTFDREKSCWPLIDLSNIDLCVLIMLVMVLWFSLTL